MTTEISTLLAAAAERTVPVVRGIRDEQLGDPTPCTEFQVRDLLNHLSQVVVNFQLLATREQPEFGNAPDVVADGWRDRFADETERLVTAWSDPAVLEGESPRMGLPQALVGNLVLVDLMVHGWDLARATGQPYRPDDSAVKAVLPFVERMAPMGRSRGVFGAEVATPADADDFDRLLAICGRAAT
ncbi:TIGR03086 family metal-binding protein [Actinoplanes solisilvae]|uniref:TIGR03086 family metal-binding protein n=1 Tax=Actinoplanes solisilvae TaxID=2486853 RepID=UPI000FDCD9F1|nr:TIGR03086 family metal-binding protein [Actinoplanes solisilvae]